MQPARRIGSSRSRRAVVLGLATAVSLAAVSLSARVLVPVRGQTPPPSAIPAAATALLTPDEQTCASRYFFLTPAYLRLQPPAKLQAIRRMLDLCVRTVHNTPGPRLPPPPTPSTTPAPEPDRILTNWSPFSQDPYIIENVWAGDRDHSRLSVYAGAPTGDPTQGMVLILVLSYDRVHVLRTGGLYLTPSRDGPVRIMGWTGNVLILRAADGTAVAFDLESRKYVPVPAATATAAAGATPAATNTPARR